MWEFLHDVPYVQLPAAKNLQGAMAAEKVDTDCKEVGKEAVAMRCRQFLVWIFTAILKLTGKVQSPAPKF